MQQPPPPVRTGDIPALPPSASAPGDWTYGRLDLRLDDERPVYRSIDAIVGMASLSLSETSPPKPSGPPPPLRRQVRAMQQRAPRAFDPATSSPRFAIARFLAPRPHPPQSAFCLDRMRG